MVWSHIGNVCNYPYLLPLLKLSKIINSAMINFDPSLGKQCWAFQIQHNHESYLHPPFCQTSAFMRIPASFPNSVEFLQFLAKYVDNKDRNLTTMFLMLNQIHSQSAAAIGRLVLSELLI